jgi:hypothetical protein
MEKNPDTVTLSGRTFTRRSDGMVVVCARQGIPIDMFRDARNLRVVAREWLAEWA